MIVTAHKEMNMACSMTDKNVAAMIEDGTMGEDMGFGAALPPVKAEPENEDCATLKENLSDLKSS